MNNQNEVDRFNMCSDGCEPCSIPDPREKEYDELINILSDVYHSGKEA